MKVKLAAANPKRRAAWRVASGLAIAASLLGVAEVTWGDDRVPGRPIASVIGLLEARSPGERNGASLTKLKKKISKNKVEESHQRVLGKVFPPAPPNTVPPEDLLINTPRLDFAEFQYPPLTLDETIQGNSIPPGAALYYAPPIGQSSGGNIGGSPGPNNGGSSGGGSSGGGIGGGPVGEVPPLVPEVPAAVPEPETWALMLLGAALCAAALRRDKSSRRRSFVADA
jgi:uncharacterized membrane protein YgcG